jgi:hypothetical protein
LVFEYGWGTVRDGYRLPHIRTRMDEVLLAQLLIVTLGLVGFGIWFTRLSMKLGEALDDISDSDDQLAEIREMITQVAQVLNHLPEILPQFHMNNSPTDFLKPIVEAFVGNITGTPPLKTVGPAQGSDGRFNGSETQDEIKTA